MLCAVAYSQEQQQQQNNKKKKKKKNKRRRALERDSFFLLSTAIFLHTHEPSHHPKEKSYIYIYNSNGR
jgi:hypothetical protein